MEHKLFHVLLIVNAVCMAIGNPIDSTSYRFEVYPVDKCPMNKSEFEEAAIRKNCSRDTRYLCAPDRSLSSLIEFCTDVRKSLFGPDNCVRLEGTGNLNHYNCEEFSSDCPSAPYFDDEIYRYPACLSINRDLNCFVADTNCTESLCDTTALEMCLNNSKSEDSTSKMEINTSKTHSNMNKIIISVVCVFVTIVIGILGLYFYKRLRKNSGKTKKQIDEDKLKDFLSKGEVTVRHVRCIIVGCGGAGKTTLLRRLQNAKFKDLKNTDMTELVDVHVNIFDVLENENTIQSVHNENQLPSITFPPNLFEENDTTPQLAETPFRAEQLTEENDQSENRDIEISEHESLIDNFESVDESEYEETEWPQLLNGAEEQVELVQLVSRNTTLNTEENPNQILEENETNNYTNPVLDDSAKYAFSKIMDAVKELSSDNHVCPKITFLDFAGQSMYYAFQQIYFSPKTCYILVVDMTKEFNKQVHETDEKCCSLFESWTYKDYYQFWLILIDSYSDLDSPVILVGTHAENLSKQDSEKFFREFHALFKDHPDIPRHLNKARNFAIGFPEKGSKLADLKEIKSCIANIVNLRGYSDQIQPVWALFEHIMQEEKRRRIIPRKTLSDYNKELSEEYRLNDENITQMLLFLHRVGNLLYFDEGILNETIILDVRWFVNAFTNIIEYHENIASADHNSSRFKTTGEITDQELIAIWESNEEGQTYISHKKEVLSYMEHFGLVAICDAQKGTLPFYYFPSMNKRKFKNQSNDFGKSSILCFQFNKKGQLPFNIFYRLVVKCLKIPKWSISQVNEENCLYENVACFSYLHYIVVVCLCKFQIQLQVWNPERNGQIDQELLGNLQQSVEESFSGGKYLYKIGYKCKNGMLNTEEDDSFIAQTEFPVSKLNCPNCSLEKKHLVDNQICWVHPGEPGFTSTTRTLKDVKDMEGEQTLKIVLTVKVLEIMPPITYTSKKGVSQMLTGIVADTEAFADIHVYDVAKFPLFRVDEAVKISDFIKKADGSLVITQISNVSTTKARIVDIPLEVKEAASKKSDCVSVLTAATSPLRSTVSVKGKVVFAGKSTTKRLRLSGEEVAFKRLKVKDSTGVVNIALWRDFAESPIEKGSFVTLHNFQTTQTYDINTKSQKPVLSNRSSKSAVEFIPSFDDISDDSNDSEMKEDSSLVGEILGIKSLYTYRCCLIDKCCKKKVTMEFRCPTCGIQYTVQSAGHAAILKLLIKGSEMTLFTAFTECINQLLSSMNIAMDLSNKEKTLKSLMAALPIKVSYSFTGTNVTKLKKL